MSALGRHWPEYLMEAFGLGAFMVSACLFGTLLEHPASPARQALPDLSLRLALAGLAMGGTAFLIFHSPWGKQSGAHINPAVTLTFLRLGKIAPADAVCYVVAQFLGGLAGVLLSALVLGEALADPAVRYVATLPGPRGALVAFAAELAISFGVMTLVLHTASRPRLAPWTATLVSVLVALYITFEAPLSGMSMNPARTLASALPSGAHDSLSLYFLAPPLGMLAAAEAFQLSERRGRHCAKLHHANDRRCIFCGKGVLRPATASLAA